MPLTKPGWVPETPRVRLRGVQQRDAEALYRAATDPATGFRWRYRGSTPSPDDFRRTLFEGVLAQYIAEHVPTGQPLGLVVAYNADHANGHAYLAVLGLESKRRPGLLLEACALFVLHVFNTWQFRKLYIEVPGFNMGQFASGLGRAFHEEGTLKDHDYYAGELWDRHILAVYRGEWSGRFPWLAAALTGSTPQERPES